MKTAKPIKTTKAAKEFSQFDIPAEVDSLFRTAELSVRDTFALAIRHGNDWRAITDEVCEWMFANRHSAEGLKRHAATVRAAEAVWIMLTK
jgi:hypothetical protein